MPLLVEHLLEQLGAEMNRRVEGVATDAMSLLMNHTWPGNVRELRNILERGMVVATGHVLQASDLGLRRPPCIDAENGGTLASLEEVERHHIARVLQDSDGNISLAARTLGIDRATLYNKLRKYQLRKDGEPETNGEEKSVTAIE
jgi:two-component system, NtrC family, response regulator AtoC